jgi:hypothetical protein
LYSRGDRSVTHERLPEPTQLDVDLDTLDKALDGSIDTVESGALDQLSAAEKISSWQRFETFRNCL